MTIDIGPGPSLALSVAGLAFFWGAVPVFLALGVESDVQALASMVDKTSWGLLGVAVVIGMAGTGASRVSGALFGGLGAVAGGVVLYRAPSVMFMPAIRDVDPTLLAEALGLHGMDPIPVLLSTAAVMAVAVLRSRPEPP